MCTLQLTGYLAKLFFSEKNRENVITAVSNMRGWRETWQREMLNSEKTALRQLLQRFSVIGRVISSDSLVKVNTGMNFSPFVS